MVRLVKGAYWDSEIKRAQVDGLDGYPVFTRKVHTDVVLPRLRAQAARRAATRSTRSSRPTTRTRWPPIYDMAGARLRRRPVRVPVPARHGRAAVRAGVGRDGKLGRPCRIYAPVGTHETLLAYLVRRLLENGANTSFVNRIADPDGADRRRWSPIPVDARRRALQRRSARRIRRSRCRATCYGAGARNSRGLDLANEEQLAALAAALHASARQRIGAPCRCSATSRATANAQPVSQSGRSPRRRRHGRRGDACRCRGRAAQRPTRAPRWAATPPAERAALLERAADLLEARLPSAARPDRARGRQDLRQRGRRSARGGRLPALLRGAGAARLLDNATHRPLGPGRLHQPVELPARDLHRPGRRGARRRQPGARQAGRADAADRGRGGARCCTRPACRARRCSSCPGAARSAARAGRRSARRAA